MKKINSKKGVSEVVSIVLIIMITVAAVAILWAIVIPLVKDSLNKGSLCFSAQSDIQIVSDQGRTCKGGTINGLNNSGNISVQVNKRADEKVELTNLSVIVTDSQGNSEAYYPFGSDLPTNNNDRTEVFGNGALVNPVSVKVAAVLKVGNTQKTCEPSPEFTLPVCN